MAGCRRCINRAQKAEAQLRSTKASARNLQMAIAQEALLYAAGLTWNGRKGEHQAAMNRMGRATLGAFQSALLGIVVAKSALAPARALLALTFCATAAGPPSEKRSGGNPKTTTGAD